MGFALPSHSKSRYYILKTTPFIQPILILFILFFIFEIRDPLFLLLSLFIMGIPLGLITYIFLFYVINDSIIFITNYKVESQCREGNYEESISLLEKRSTYGLGKTVKTNLKATKAMVFLKQGNYEKTKEILEELLNDYPNFLTALYYKACLEITRGNINKAERVLNRMKKIYEKMIRNKKSPITKYIYKKKRNNFLDKLTEDEDLQYVTKEIRTT